MKKTFFEVKSLLAIYNFLPQVTESIDRLVATKASCSCVQNLDDGASKQIESVINLMEQKVNLINLKLLTEQTLCDMKESYSKLVIARYIDKMGINFLAESIGFGVRETFRRIKKATEEFKRVFFKNIEKNQKVWQKITENFFWLDVLDRIDRFEKVASVSQLCPEFMCNMIIKKLRRIV